MKFYDELGFLILGSRLRRLSEYYLSEVNKIYHQRGLIFDASWFPTFYILSKGEPVSLTDISRELLISHSAVSQLIKSLKEKQLVLSELSKADGRHQMIRLSKQGYVLLDELKPIWEALSSSLEKMEQEKSSDIRLLPALTALEENFEKETLSSIVLNKLIQSKT